MKKKYYAVRVGRNNGIFQTWDECKKQVMGFKGAIYKSFESLDDAENFLVDNNKTFDSKADGVFYVDGSFDVKTNAFSYGIVLLKDNEEICFNKKCTDEDLAKMRNVSGEILGAETAMKYSVENGFKNIEIHFDYEGIEKWATGLWKTNKEGTIAYKKYYDSIKDKLNVKFVKVKGHSGDKYNDMADRLAKDALGL